MAKTHDFPIGSTGPAKPLRGGGRFPIGNGGPATPPPAPADRRPRNWLLACVSEASDIYAPVGVLIYLQGHNDRLGTTPIDLIARGDGERVYEDLRRLGGMVAA